MIQTQENGEKPHFGPDRLFQFFLQLLYLESGSLSVAYLTVAHLARLEISVHCQVVSVRSQYLVRLLSQCWITVGHIIYPPIEGLLTPTGIEPTPFPNSTSKVAGLQVYATTIGLKFGPTFFFKFCFVSHQISSSAIIMYNIRKNIMIQS